MAEAVRPAGRAPGSPGKQGKSEMVATYSDSRLAQRQGKWAELQCANHAIRAPALQIGCDASTAKLSLYIYL
jgi:hypothetical protein